ncbi:hypothetical protein L249_2292 [Ophiocordyceps polyrhachis-furcata BCC 54312]|uniref:Uncharacterized protein n=1 Tax=Ophiocordyceps polyrhachis-furcata BCC 54312 TaxID=1330021 RepID=A0A367LPW6_9HYPO|nr:hypothetical protein L249_2292 [Ophiocordyceps polyrhachis-furcata BCC 54312]
MVDPYSVRDAQHHIYLYTCMGWECRRQLTKEQRPGFGLRIYRLAFFPPRLCVNQAKRTKRGFCGAHQHDMQAMCIRLKLELLPPSSYILSKGRFDGHAGIHNRHETPRQPQLIIVVVDVVDPSSLVKAWTNSRRRPSSSLSRHYYQLRIRNRTRKTKNKGRKGREEEMYIDKRLAIRSPMPGRFGPLPASVLVSRLQ